MFGMLNKKQKTPENILFLINMHIGRGTNTEIPTNLVGAYVPAFVAAPNHEAAAHEVVSNLTRQGYEFIDIADGKIHQLDPLKWDSYVMDAWPEFVAHFPKQSEVISKLPSKLLFFGPFASYEASNA
ncbi:hypothetical protein [Methylotenera sp. G11]|uniref:hypothetical protein n=1 Tax=Methylotenera sp. G11 TaxID=1506585 RepID=UPI00064687C3|nr:hypothetical protein [Methylotenera sp. G11]